MIDMLFFLKEIGPERPPRSPYRPFPVKEEEESSDDDGFLPIQKPWTLRPRTLSTGEPATRRVGDSSRGRQACSEDGVPRRGQRVCTCCAFSVFASVFSDVSFFLHIGAYGWRDQ